MDAQRAAVPARHEGPLAAEGDVLGREVRDWTRDDRACSPVIDRELVLVAGDDPRSPSVGRERNVVCKKRWADEAEEARTLAEPDVDDGDQLRLRSELDPQPARRGIDRDVTPQVADFRARENPSAHDIERDDLAAFRVGD